MTFQLMRTRSVGNRQICEISLTNWGWGYTTEPVSYRNSYGVWFTWKIGFIHLTGWDHN